MAIAAKFSDALPKHLHALSESLSFANANRVLNANSRQAASIFDKLRKLPPPMRSNCSSPAGGARSPASLTTQFIRTLPKRRTTSRCVSLSAAARRALLPTSMMTRACVAWCSRPRRWPACSSPTRPAAHADAGRGAAERRGRGSEPGAAILRQHSPSHRRAIAPPPWRRWSTSRRSTALTAAGIYLFGRSGRGHLQFARRRRLV